MNEHIQALETRLATFALEGDENQVELLNELAWSLRNLDASRALTISQQALALAERCGDRSGEAYALLARSFARRRLSENRAALADAERALERFEELDDHDGLNRVLNTLGIIHAEASSFDEALKSFLTIKKLHEEDGNFKALADALNNIGIVHGHLGDFSAALEYYLQSLALCSDLSYRDGEIRALLNVGVVYQDLGRPRDALEYLRKTLALVDVESDAHTYALTLINIGQANEHLGNHSEALTAIRESVGILEAMGHSLVLSEAYDILGTIHQRIGAPAEAEAYLRRSLAIKAEAGNRKGEAATQLALGQLLLEKGDYEEGIAGLRRALELSEDVGGGVEAQRSHAALAAALERKGDYRAALEHFKRHAELKDQVFNEASDRRLHALRIGFEVEQTQKEREIFRLKNVELAAANAELEAMAQSLRAANIEQKNLLKRLKKQASEDALTGLYNRRHFDQIISAEFGRARRHGYALSAMICDIDNFKQVNDRFSHQIGDEVLKAVGQLMRAHCREYDTVARYGGEEFTMLLPQTEPALAAEVCDRLRAAVEAYPWSRIHPELTVTLSIGISGDLSLANHEKLLAAADEKLYEAKFNGKNQVNY